MSGIVNLKAAVHRGTTDHGGEEGDPSGIIEIQLFLESNPQLIPDAVSLLKARIKDRSPITELLALDLLDQCMRCNGIDFHSCVMEKVLPRILKMALPHNGIHPRVQQKAAHLIKYWSSSCNYDSHLQGFIMAGKTLASKREKVALAASAASSKVAPSTASRGFFGHTIKALVPRVLFANLEQWRMIDCRLKQGAGTAPPIETVPPATAPEAPNAPAEAGLAQPVGPILVSKGSDACRLPPPPPSPSVHLVRSRWNPSRRGVESTRVEPVPAA